MSQRHCRTFVLGLLALAPSSAWASYAYSTDFVGLSSTGPTTINVYLDDPTGFIATENGLFSAAFSVTRIRGTAARITDITFNPQFDFTPGLVKNISNGLGEASSLIADASPGVTYTTGLGNRIFLGTVTIAPDPAGFGFTTFRVDDFASIPATGWVVTYQNYVEVDASPIAPSFFGFSLAVPEPSSATTVGALCAAVLMRRRR